MMSEPITLNTVQDAMARLGVGRSTVYEMINRGDLDTVHIGRRVLVPSDSIAEYIDRNRVSAVAS